MRASLVVTLLATTAALASDATATEPPGLLVGFSVKNPQQKLGNDYYAGEPLELSISGANKCRLKVVLETQKGVVMYTRNLVLDLPATYKADFNLPPYGKAGYPELEKQTRDYRVRVEPVADPKQGPFPCAGVPRSINIRTICTHPGSGAYGYECRASDPPAATAAGASSTAPTSSASEPKPKLVLPIQPSGSGAPAYAPAKGNIASMQVPGGSFAVDEAQKIKVNGSGGCGLDLFVSNKSYGGSFEKTYDVAPVTLTSGATLYNGTHFGTLAEGSYTSKATGKNGCTGQATVDFKVTGPTTLKKVTGKATLSFDKPPQNGMSFNAKDSNIWFKVALPSSVKAEPNATCCELEFDFKNAYGGWEALPNSPFQDSGFGQAVSQNAAVVFKSVSGFKEGREWRVKMKAYKYKTEFEWSDWLTFQVDPK